MSPSFQLIDAGWDKVIGEAVATNCKELSVVCPFIKLSSAKRLLASKCPELMHVITRFHLGEMCAGVNDVGALRLLLEKGAKIRGIKGLHAKLYLFGDKRAVVTSANLTEAALLRNHEFGFVTSESQIIKHCREYFNTLWKKGGPDLDLARLENWEKRIEATRLAGSPPSSAPSLPDEGMDTGLTAKEIVNAPALADAKQFFVKFFGEGHKRASWDMSVFDEVKRSGSHWACSYSAKKRPRKVKDGAVIFMGRLVANPHDTIIYGRAIGFRHVAGRDEASAEEIKRRTWKEMWPIYVRVHRAEFIAGTLANGIRLSALMNEFKSDSFLSTQRNSRKGGGNTDPHSAYRQQAAVQLTNEAFAWLNDRLEKAFTRHGKLTPAELETLDWPEVSFHTAPLPEHLDVYQSWLVDSDRKAEDTARICTIFLARCSEHYGETINKQTMCSDAQVDALLERVSHVVAQRGRWTEGTFNLHDITEDLTPALRAYVRFVKADIP